MDDKLICKTCGQEVRSSRSLKKGQCRECRERERRTHKQAEAINTIASLLDRDDVLILDTETTGMKAAEVIELSIINTRGDILLDTLIKPKTTHMNPYAYRVHGISLAMLKDAPSWPEVMPELSRVADQATILAWNAGFDARMLTQTSQLWDVEHPRWLFACAMRLYAQAKGIRARGLQKVVIDENLGHLHQHWQSHRALGDVMFVLEVLRACVQLQRDRLKQVASSS